MVGVGLFDVVLGGVVLLVEQSPEVLGGEGNDVGGVLLDDCLRVVLEDVGQFFGHHDLFGTVDALFPHVGHFCNLYYYVRAVRSTHFIVISSLVLDWLGLRHLIEPAYLL